MNDKESRLAGVLAVVAGLVMAGVCARLGVREAMPFTGVIIGLGLELVILSRAMRR